MRLLITLLLILATGAANAQVTPLWPKQNVGATTVGINARAWFNADSGTYSKGRPVLVDADTLSTIATHHMHGTAMSAIGQVEGQVSELNGANLTVTGGSTKTITATKAGSTWMQTTFTDNDNQTLSVTGRMLSITGGNSVNIPAQTLSIAGNTLSISDGNSVDLPAFGEPVLTSTGSTATTYTLPITPADGTRIQVIMNTATIHPSDWTFSGNQVHLGFPVATTDHIVIYYKTAQ